MSRRRLVFYIIVLQLTTLTTTAETDDKSCERTASSRSWKKTVSLNWLRWRCRWEKRNFIFSTEDAEYYFDQQEKFRGCLIEQLETGYKSSITYFGKDYERAMDLRYSEKICAGKGVDLKIRCREALENPLLSEKFNVLPDFLTPEEPLCVKNNVYLKTIENHRSIERTSLRCPGRIKRRDQEKYQLGVYLSLADDPRFDGSLVYVFMLEEGKVRLNVATLLLTWQLKMVDDLLLK